MECSVELLSIGNELLLGNTVNTNASWLAAQITSLGGKVARTTTVRDNLRDISEAVREAVNRKPEFIITTGGIGPTFDDMTVKGVAKALRLRLKLSERALRMIQEHYARRLPHRKVSLTRPRLKMALIPSGGEPIPNPVGTAPCVLLRAGKTQIFILPGVPKEAKAIFRSSVSKAISLKAGGTVFVEKWLGVHGIMESSLAPIIDKVMSQWPDVYVKSHPRGFEGSAPLIELHFSMTTTDSAKAKQVLFAATRDATRQLKNLKAETAPKRRKCSTR
jgi:molybdenum cofactor synthesis domain-containing protein